MNQLSDFIKSRWRRWKQADLTDRAGIGFVVFTQIALLGALALALYERAWLTLFICAAAIIVVWAPSLLAGNLRVHFPLEFDLLLNIFIYASIFLGEIRGYYTRFWWWDIVLHAGSGIALGFLGFLILYSLYLGGRLKISPFLLALFSFCFALALGALWEIFEFALDSWFGFNMQKSGLRDTMWDLIVDAAGALLIAISGFLYVRYQRHGTGLFRYYLNSYLKPRA